jgi:phosphoglycolate phosphatase-like HAD superfamily hydrolase
MGDMYFKGVPIYYDPTLDDLGRSKFAYIWDSSDIYLYALEDMKLDPKDVIVVEDSENGMRAAVAAGLPTVVTVSTFTVNEDFSPASLVVSHLGDSGPEEKTSVLRNPHGVDVGNLVTLNHLQELISIHNKA